LEILEDRLAPARLTVNSTADTANPTDPYLTLREAIAIVNSPTLPSGLSDPILAQISGGLHAGGFDTIAFDPAAVDAPIRLGQVRLELSLPASTAAVRIDGGTAGVTVDGNNNATLIFQVDSGVQALFDRLTLSHGNTAIYNAGGTLTVSNSTVSANSADYSGGGIWNGGGTLTVSNCTLSANSAGGNGAALGNSLGMLTVSNCTLSGNSARGSGGGIYSDGTLHLVNDIVAGNAGASGPDIWGVVSDTSTHNLVGRTDHTLTGMSHGVGGNLVGSLARPLDARLGPLTNNGGPTRTHALLADSQARGAGTLAGATATDQRGLPRVVSGEIDLGSYQEQSGVPGPRVVVSDPVGVIDPPVNHVRTTFNHPMDSATLTAARFRLTGPGGNTPVTAVTAVPSTNDQQFDVSFASRTEPGDYALTVGAGVRDVHGTSLGSPFTTRFSLFGLTGCVLTVNSSADTSNPSDPYLSLREAVAIVNSPTLPTGLSPQILEQIQGTLHAHGSDLIVFDPATVGGRITLNGPQLELRLSGDTARITIDGGEGVTVGNANDSRIFQIDGGVQAVLDHLTLIRGGASNYSGAISASGASLTVSNCTLAGLFRESISASDSTLTVTNSALTRNSGVDGAGIDAVGGSVTVADSSLTGNSASDQGGALFAESASVTVTNCTLSGNSANYASGGGGICASFHSTVTVTDSILTDNYSSYEGGGIAAATSRVTVTNCALTGNSAARSGGGGISATWYSSVTVTRSTLMANSAAGGVGGGISVGDASVTVSDCTLTRNSAQQGAAIDAQGATLTVSNSTLSRNSTSGYGGGGISTSASTVTVTNSTLTDNSSSFNGGGISVNGGPTGSVMVTSCTLAGNTVANGLGGAIYTGLLDTTVADCTVTGNSATRGGGIYLNSFGRPCRLENTIVAGNRADAGENGADVKGAMDADSSYNLIGAGDSTLDGIRDGTNHNRVGTTDEPLDPLLAPLGWYGGPTQTFALLPGSLARNAGTPASAGPADQRGLPRVGGGANDIGAFQTQTDPFRVTTLTDPGRQFRLLSLREAVNLANVLPGDHTVSFDHRLDGGIVTLTAGQLELSGSGGLTTIDGASRSGVSGADRSRLFSVEPGTTAVLRGLGLLSGNAPSGAGVLNRGTLTVASCTLYGNTAYNGGAILNQGWLTLSGSTLAFNVATLGAGIDNEGYLVAYNSTFAFNAALQAGGAVRNEATGTAVLTSLTVSRNSADEGGGIDVLPGSAVLLRNCIVAGNYSAYASFASDVAGTLDPGSSYNLIGTGGSGGLSDGVSHNLVGVADPGLTTPDFSNHETPVFGFTPDSPALGAGDPSLLDDPDLRLDQHGNPRSVVNIGAL
jgi:predicted outer membrane repeat protein